MPLAIPGSTYRLRSQLSPWTHAALYIGRLRDIQVPQLKRRIRTAYEGHPDDQLVIESLLA